MAHAPPPQAWRRDPPSTDRPAAAPPRSGAGSLASMTSALLTRLVRHPAVRHGAVALASCLLLIATVVPGTTSARLLPVGAADAVPLTSDTTDHAAGTASWVWPTGTRVIRRPWEAPADDYAAGHRGIDVPAALGTPAVAVDDGEVAFAGSVAGRPVVTIDHGDGLVSTLDSVSPSAEKGDVVQQGDVVGAVAVGHCPASTPCLHLGARIDGRYVDPTPYLPAAAWPVLLPEAAWPAEG